MTAAQNRDIPRRIVIMIDNLGMGGAQKLLLIQIAEMRETHDLLIVNMGPETHLARDLVAQGFDVISSHGIRLTDFGAMRDLRRVLAKWQPELIHTHLMYATLVGSLMARWLKVPHVATLHNERPDLARFADKIKVRLEQHVLERMTDVVVACGPKIAVIQKPRTGKTPLVTVANRVRPATPLAPEKRAALRRDMGDVGDTVLVLAAGRMMPQKGFDLLISAFARVVRSHPKARLVIIGDGPDRADLEKRVARLSLQECVSLPGAVPDLADMLQSVDVFALPSRHEGLPLVLIEAMAAGLPIVATRVGDVATVLDESSGLLIEAGQVEPLTEALERLVSDARLRETLRERALAASRNHTDVDAFIAEMTAVYGMARQRYDQRT
jgi:L-malate glycosyltransferase